MKAATDPTTTPWPAGSVDAIRQALHYEGAIWGWDKSVRSGFGEGPGAPDGGKAASDLICPMYPAIDALVAWAKDDDPADRRPMILCEYSHAMGNSNGSLSDYWDAFETHHGLQGGFIWEWADHGILRHDAKGRRRSWPTEETSATKPNDLNFCCDGIVGADRVPHPGLHEFKALAQPVAVVWDDEAAGRLRVRNKRDFIDLGDLTGSWVLEADGEEIASGVIPRLFTPPGASEVVALQLPPSAPSDERELFLTIRFALAEATMWAPAGHELACAQLQRNGHAVVGGERKGRRVEDGPGEAPRVTEDDREIRVSCGGLEAAFDRTQGRMTSLTWRNHPILAAGPRLQIWRGATDNDGIKGWTGQRRKPLGRWKAMGLPDLAFLTPSTRVWPTETGAIVTIAQATSCDAAQTAVVHTHSYEFGTGGRIHVRNEFHVHPELDDLPRLGVTLTLPDDFESLAWLGRGPLESYVDRQRAAYVGLWSGTVNGQYVPYVVPQEHGNKTDVRWMQLTGDAATVRFVPDEPCEGSATRFTPQELFAASHTIDLTPHAEVIVNLDIRQRGLGTGSCGPDTLERYRIGAGDHRLDFEIRPLPRQNPRS